MKTFQKVRKYITKQAMKVPDVLLYRGKKKYKMGDKGDWVLVKETMSVGAGVVAGFPPDIPPVNRFAGARVFDVDADAIHKSRFGKPKYKHYKKYVGGNEEARKYARKKHKEPVLLRHKETGTMVYLRTKD